MAMVLRHGMKDLTVPIDPAGRIVLPKTVREELAIKAGDRLRVSIHGLAITVTPAKQIPGLVRKGKALVFSTGGSERIGAETVNRVMEECREEANSRSVAPLRHGRRGQ